jgi:hypothetical protein
VHNIALTCRYNLTLGRSEPTSTATHPCNGSDGGQKSWKYSCSYHIYSLLHHKYTKSPSPQQLATKEKLISANKIGQKDIIIGNICYLCMNMVKKLFFNY